LSSENLENAKTAEKDSQYFEKYVQAFAAMNGVAGYLLNPMMANQHLKNLNMNPMYQNRDAVEKMIYNPNSNELGLRRLSQYLYNTQTPYKKLIHHYADSLSFDWYPIPMNIKNKKDFEKDTYKKDWDRMWEWFDKFDVKKEFKKIFLGMMLEDTKYTYLRESEYGLTLQEMPADYSIIDATSQIGYLYSFNLMYFQQLGADISGFDPEFRKFYNQMLDYQKNKTYYPNARPENRDGRWAYWQQMNPNKAWVFKFHDTYATSIPPFLGLFIDAIDLDRQQQLQNDTDTLNAYKMIFGTIPRHKDGTNKGSNSKDDFAIDPKTLSNYIQLVKASLPSGVDFKAAPLEDVQMFEFEGNQGDNLSSTAIKNMYLKSGAEKALFGSDKPNASTMKASIQNDMNFITRVYSQFESFVNYHLSKVTLNYKFRVKFEGTEYDREARKADTLTDWQSGILTPQLCSARGLTVKEFDNSIGMMQSLGFPESCKPLATSFTQSGDGTGDKKAGRKASKEVSDAGEITRDADSNLDKSDE
jgi:hypothetical protein